MPPTLCTVNAAGGSLGPAPWLLVCFFGANQSSVHNFVDCGFLVPGASDNELVVGWNVAAENRRRLLRLSKKDRDDIISESKCRNSQLLFKGTFVSPNYPLIFEEDEQGNGKACIIFKALTAQLFPDQRSQFLIRSGCVSCIKLWGFTWNMLDP